MDLKTKGLLVVFSGPSGSGKDTVLAELKSRNINLVQSISATTRDMREGEADGVDYYFIDVASFEKGIEEGYFLEYVKYGKNYYGTPLKKVKELIDEGHNVFLKIEVEGAANVRKIYPEAVSIFIVPPSLEELERRLRGRGTETEETFRTRFAIARDEIKRANEYDYVIINGIVENCADDICSVITSEASKYHMRKDFIDSFLK